MTDVERAQAIINQVLADKAENVGIATCVDHVREHIDAIRTDERGSTRRRERLDVAARIMAGMYACKCYDDAETDDMADAAVLASDALIARIDAEEGKS